MLRMIDLIAVSQAVCTIEEGALSSSETSYGHTLARFDMIWDRISDVSLSYHRLCTESER